MAIDFPASPAVDQVFEAGGVTFTFNGTGWTQGGSGGGGATGDFVLKTGDTMTGSLSATGYATYGASPSININKDNTGASNTMFGMLNGSGRWAIDLGDATAESGANAGSNFTITRYDDAGVGINIPLSISRASGNMTLIGAMNVISGGVSVENIPPTGNGISGIVNGQNRWILALGEGGAETGSNAGSNFALDGYSDTGTFLGRWININRSSGQFHVGVIGTANNWAPTGNLQVSAMGWMPAGGPWSPVGSDARIKTVLGDYSRGLADLVQLNPVNYRFKGNDTPASVREGEVAISPHAQVLDQTFIGLIAQDVEAVVSEMVIRRAGWIDGQEVSDLRTLDLNALTYMLINAVKELSARVEALEAAQP